MPAFPELTEPLHGERVALRYAAERDIPEILIAHQDDPELHVRLGLVRPPSGAELGRRIEGGAERPGGGDRRVADDRRPRAPTSASARSTSTASTGITRGPSWGSGWRRRSGAGASPPAPCGWPAAGC